MWLNIIIFNCFVVPRGGMCGRRRNVQHMAVTACVLQGEYYEAVAKAIDVKRKELVACFPKDAGLDEACFKISYDVLIVGVSYFCLLSPTTTPEAWILV